MKVRELMEKLAACDPEADVLFHEFMEMDTVMDMEFSTLEHVHSGYADSTFMANTDHEITVYSAQGTHQQGYKIDRPVVALSHTELTPVKTNATVTALSGRGTR